MHIFILMAAVSILIMDIMSFSIYVYMQTSPAAFVGAASIGSIAYCHLLIGGLFSIHWLPRLHSGVWLGFILPPLSACGVAQNTAIYCWPRMNNMRNDPQMSMSL